MNLNKVYLSLGSNIGDKINNLQNSINVIDSRLGNVISISSVYQTVAEGFYGEDFFNCCISLNTQYEPKILLKKIIEIEVNCGRKRSNSKFYESRKIDIDILYYENKIIDEDNLTIPHPRMHTRKFVLVPLKEIANSKVHPILNETTDNLVEKLNFNDIIKIDQNLTLPILIKLGSFKNIVIEGNIGVGKTSLSKKLSKDLNKDLIIEQYLENPFLEKYYENPNRYALNVELTFLADRCRQLMDFNNQISFFSSGIVADYDIFKSLVFASVSLKEVDYNLFRKIFYQMTKGLFKSNLVIYLVQSSDQLLKNIKKRGRNFEKQITKEYLDKIHSAYQAHLKNNFETKTIFIDVSDLDFVESKDDYLELLFRLKNKLV